MKTILQIKKRHKVLLWKGNISPSITKRRKPMRTLMACVLILFFSTIVNAKIVFDSKHDRIHGIYVMDDDGGNITPLIESDTLRPGNCRWSPNGEQILFKRRVSVHGNYAIYLMNTDGTNERQITDADGISIRSTSFSPDGKSFVFHSSESVPAPHGGGNTIKWSINILNLKSGKIEQISDHAATAKDWSPDGKYIAFAKPRGVGGFGGTIWIMRANGNDVRELIPAPLEDRLIIHRWYPKFSPDSQQILYTQREYVWENLGIDEEHGTIIALIHKAHRYIICNKNGITIRKLNIPLNWECISLDWMDDGKSILFSAREVELNTPPVIGETLLPGIIYKYHLATNKITQLTHNSWDNSIVDWISDQAYAVSPVGKQSIQWGKLKALLNTRIEALKTFSSSLPVFLSN